ncbi:MAG: flagellar protein FlaG [candidate division Zixibacteria bacterium]|nr:flagellar protein FlaG [candidate division Zixibacteria bacterium]
MINELTTQQVSEGAVKGPSLSLGGTEKIGAPAKRDNASKLVEDLGSKLSESKTAGNQPEKDVDKVKEIVKEAKEAVDFVNKFVKDVQVDLKYAIDEATNEVVIQIYEKGTDKMIRQIPPEAIMHLKERINDLLGIIYDETA